jgi:hypothetical protein
MGRVLSIGLLLSFALTASAFGQSTYATVSGTVADASGAVLPGVSVTATNTGTGVVTTVVSNESGAYNFASLLPGPYKVSAELPGFQTQTYTDVQLGNAAKIRLNFALQVATQAQSVEVTVAADTLLAASSSSVGEVLSQSRVQDLPTISNNVMDIYRLIPGVRVNADGVSGSFAGLSGFGTTNIVRDGIDAAGGARFTANAYTATYMSPDLIGEVRVVVAPVDAEMGRGNAQLQFMTRSGTNQFRGSAVWVARNSALDANTWNNNRQVNPRTGAWSPTPANWNNTHQFTGSYSGPIARNRTFFFALWDMALVNGRTTQNPVVLTPCARNGIFRYFDNWNNGNFLQVPQATTATPTIAVVDAIGNPVTPTTNPDGSPFTGTLHYTSVFGPVQNTPTKPDCSDAIVGSASTPTGTWDANRTQVDPTGFVAKLLGQMPLPNNYQVGDGLNTAGYLWARREKDGSEGIFPTSQVLTAATFLGRKQINVKIDHNFNSKNKLGASYTYERSAGNASGAFELWPNGFRAGFFRHPQTLSLNFTSTVSPTIVNELRLGMRRTGSNTFNGFNDPINGKAAQAFFPNISGYPVFVGLGTNQVNFQTSQPLGGGTTATYNDVTPLWSYGDSLSWTKGKHAFKFGGELRRGHSLGYDAGIATTSIPRAIGGDTSLGAIPTAAISGTNVPGLAGTSTTGNNVTMRNLLSFLAGSLSQVTQFYYMQSPTKLDAFENYKTFPQRVRDTHLNEASAFFKDDWKMLKSLTLNLGLRWEYYGVLYDGNGLMPLPVGGPGGIFGISGNSFDGWMKPGVRGTPTVMQFVGKNSPNPNTPWYPDQWKNFGPAVGFAWQVPWLGANKTTVRGGYQMTYNAGPSFNSITQENVAPSSTLSATYAGDSSTNAYLDLRKLPSLIPVPQIIKPMQPIPLTDRTQQMYVPQPGLKNPYAQNITLAVTRSVTNNLTVDVRYIGTLGRKQLNAAFQINQPDFLYNGLKEAFDAARAGNDSSPALQVLENMFKGINIAGTAGSGPVGSSVNGVLQTAGGQLRASTATATGVTGNLQSNLANGNYAAVASILNVMNYSTQSNPTLPVIPGGVNGAVLRYNGFPENFIVTNPQFGNLYMIASTNSNNYHSLETQVTLRPTQGLTMQSTYTWSKNLGIQYAVGSTYTNAVDRHADYAVLPDTRVHDFRTNGTFTLPIGPGKLLLKNRTGLLARTLENWQMGWVVNLNTGAPISLVAQNMLYANGTPDIVGPFDLKGKVQWANGSSSGTYFNGSMKQIKDPQCAGVTTQQNLQASCTLNAVTDANGQLLLQNPLPGRRGTLGLTRLQGPGVWRFDGNMSKSIKINETKSVQFRFDAVDVLNHPEPATPLVNIDAANFGLITATATATAKSALHRQFQAQLRFTF